ncbi:hypothetical protein DS2_04915 [Catenovulum agarivorans DS-2]|uniref:diguanylate cyclase n=1 Tax=Catenovulum agarivorans DS-2 TaxID=1328313 RepID=W7R0N0_9ALTE|nr:GGDEF domain-containing protein [Catenovulum agarivorans]EWH11170.1 hypothetical protein DS2_04915 [Catenovulum agarivorans DS-2]
MVISDSQILWLASISITIALMASIQHSVINSRLSALPMAQGVAATLVMFALIGVMDSSGNLSLKLAGWVALLVGLYGFVSVQVWLNKWLLNAIANLLAILVGMLLLCIAAVACIVYLTIEWTLVPLGMLTLALLGYSVWWSVKSSCKNLEKLVVCIVPCVWICAIAVGFYSVFIALLMVSATIVAGLFLVLSRYVNTQKNCLAQLQELTDTYRDKTFQLKSELQEQQDAYETLESDVRERNFELEVTLRELQEKNQELERLNTLDALTGVRNRRYFDQRITAELRRARREQTELGLIMLDIDHFKSINDEYGHLVGDLVIQHIASLCKKLLPRSTDALCRYGGEEFAVILPNTPLQGGLQVADNLCQQIEQSVCHADGHQISVTASFGVHVQLVAQNNQASDLIALADKALYQAKQTGRNRVCHSAELSQTTASKPNDKPLLN